MPLPIQTLHIFPGFAVGGAQMRAVRLIEALGDGYRHGLVSLSGADAGLALMADSRAVEWIAPPPQAGSLATTRALAGLLRERRPDLVLTYNWGALDGVLACRFSGRRALVHHEDGFGPDEVVRRHGRRNLMRRIALRGAHQVAVPSQVLQTIARVEWRLPERLIELIPNGVDTARFAPLGHATDTGPDERASVRSELGIDPSAFVVVTVGGLRPEKRPDRVLETLTHLPSDVHAILVGTGSELEALERRAAESDLAGRVHLVGTRPDPAPLLRAADAFCLPSDTEQMPIAMVEAMAAGLPVVATDVGDVRAILPDEQQDRVVPPGAGAAAGLAAELRALKDDRQGREALGRANRTRVEARYTEAGMVARYDALYRAAAARDAR